MPTLHEAFEKALTNIGIAEHSQLNAVFYSAPVGIRFEIGDDVTDEEGPPVYIQNALERARTLYFDLPAAPNILRIDRYPSEKRGYLTHRIMSKLGLPSPDEVVSDVIGDDDEPYPWEHMYWDLTNKRIDAEKLLLEIIKGGLGGYNCLCSEVFFANTDKSILYHLYDDRGADIVASEKETLLRLYKAHNAWILPYDKESIDKLFVDQN